MNVEIGNEAAGAVLFLEIHKSDLVCSAGDEESTATFGAGRNMKVKIRKRGRGKKRRIEQKKRREMVDILIHTEVSVLTKPLSF